MFTSQSLEPNEYAILLNTKMELRLGVTLKLLISFSLTLFKNQVNTFIISYMFYRKRCGEQDRVVKEDYASPHCSIYKQLWGCPPTSGTAFVLVQILFADAAMGALHTAHRSTGTAVFLAGSAFELYRRRICLWHSSSWGP